MISGIFTNHFLKTEKAGDQGTPMRAVFAQRDNIRLSDDAPFKQNFPNRL
jgi:hypothetical protein